MSVVVVMHVGPYVLMGTDTRVTYFDRETCSTVVNARDGRGKMVRSPYGLISGTGSVQLLRAVNVRLLRALRGDGLTNAKVLEIITEEQQRLRADPRFSKKQSWYLINSTGWLMTLPGPPESPPLLAFYHRQRSRFLWKVPGRRSPRNAGDKIWLVKAGSAWIWLPEYAGEAKRVKAAHAELEAQIATGRRVYNDSESVIESIAHHEQLLHRVLVEAATLLPATISPSSFTIGIHLGAQVVLRRELKGEPGSTPLADALRRMAGAVP